MGGAEKGGRAGEARTRPAEGDAGPRQRAPLHGGHDVISVAAR